MTVTLTILRYRKRFIPFALLAMFFFRFPLWLNKKIPFWKLLGSGKNGTFDKNPDWQQWGILSVQSSGLKVKSLEPVDPEGKLLYKELYGAFIANWIRLFDCEAWTVFLEPIEGHGTWDGKKVFGALPLKTDYEGQVAVLTRATIRLLRLKHFWSNVAPVAGKMASTKGLQASFGIGEMPWIKQATFSIWQNKEAMKNFAYEMKEHAEVIRKTRSQKWYTEDMFTRFRIIATTGTIRGINPLTGKS